MIGNGNLNSLTISGELYITAPGIHPSFTAPANVFHQLGNFSEGYSKHVIIDKVVGTFEVPFDGDYKFDGVASIKPSAGMKINFALFKTTTKQENIETSLDFKNNQDTNTFAGTGMLWNLKKGNIISVHGKVDTVPVTVTVEFMNITLIRIGG